MPIQISCNTRRMYVFSVIVRNHYGLRYGANIDNLASFTSPLLKKSHMPNLFAVVSTMNTEITAWFNIKDLWVYISLRGMHLGSWDNKWQYQRIY